MINNAFKEIKSDLPASIIVFFVALPLCLGIALASGAPLFSGIIAGIVGGIVVGMASGSRLGVSGPAAGLAVIVFGGIAALGSWEAFCTGCHKPLRPKRRHQRSSSVSMAASTCI